MALSFGKVSGAIAAMHNETTAALVNLNADFTLIKLEAPAEYSALGNTISTKRKTDAEEGTLHKTARRLGALFKDVLPVTDELCRAYGTRVSEICSMLPTTTTQEHLGIFGSHLGLDITSIWAAATSGSAAIQAHLLACMLARIFPNQEAISLWVELVEKRKEWIRIKQGNTLYSSDHHNEIMASQQDISRSDLATWDSSARAWLQSADQAKKRQHIQTMLILNNASVPVNSEPQTYDSLMKAWTTALEAMNFLVKGIPQRVQDGATLLAVSSWHLYPDMIVHGTTHADVRQQDPLFPTGTFLTLGLQHVRDDTKSVYWSLPLACLQFYGHPVQAVRAIGPENKRITCDQFAYVILGCLFGGWNEYAVNDEDGLERLGRITDLMNIPLSLRFKHSKANTWLIYLAVAAQNYLECEEEERTVAQQLVNLGRRWSTFLYPRHTSQPPPLFGLSTLSGLLKVLKTPDHRVHCLRRWVMMSSQNGADLIIRYSVHNSDVTWVEYASTVPTSSQSPLKRTSDGNLKPAESLPAKSFRWLHASQYQLTLFVQYRDDFRDVEVAKEKLSRMKSAYTPIDSSLNHRFSNENIRYWKEIEELREVILYAQRHRYIQSLGETYLPVIQDVKSDKFKRELDTRLCFPTSKDFVEASQELLASLLNSPLEVGPVTMPLMYYAGIHSVCGLYSLTHRNRQSLHDIHLNPLFVDDFFQPDKVDLGLLQQYFASVDPNVRFLIRHLTACAMMSEVYHLLPGAEISTAVLKTSLAAAKWVNEATETPDSAGLNISQAFACIAMFDSGTCNLAPESLSQVFALSSGNSLYILASLLCDPFERPRASEIRRVVGNVGRPGMTFLISPPEVKTREADPGQWMAINHSAFDGQPANHFGNTSIHLSFTNYEIPLIPDENHQHLIDRVFVLVETLVSVYDGQTWVGEVDILKTFNHHVIQRAVNDQFCSHAERGVSYEAVVRKFSRLAATSIENWDELIEAPASGTVVAKAHKSWLARLAITAMAVKYGFAPVILPEEPCWLCCSRSFLASRDKYALVW